MKQGHFKLTSSLRVVLAACLAVSAMLAAGGAKAQVPDCKKGASSMRLLIVPFEADAAARSLAGYAYTFPLTIAEALEHDPCIRPVTGPYVLPEGLAGLVNRDGRGFDHDVAMVLARRTGATHVLIGAFSGQTWTWRMVIAIVPVDATQATVHARIGPVDMTVPVARKNGRIDHVLSGVALHTALSDVLRRAFGEYPTGSFALDSKTVAALSVPPTRDATALLRLGRAYARLLDGSDQGASATSVEAKHPGRTPVADETHDASSAIGKAANAASIDPEYVAAQRLYAQLLESRGDARRARARYEMVLEKAPDDARVLVSLGRLDLRLKDPDSAVKLLTRAATLLPRDGEPRYQLGLAELALDNGAAATKAFEDARTVMPGMVEVRLSLAKLYSETGQYADAAVELAAAVAHRPYDIDTRFLLAATWRAAGDTGKVIAAYRDLLAAATPTDRVRKALAHRFLADALSAWMRRGGATQGGDDARREYQAAALLDPADQRSSEMAARGSSALLGGDALLAAAQRARGLAARLNERRITYGYAIHYAIGDLQYDGAKACVDGRGASGAVVAVAAQQAHTGLVGELSETAAAIKTAYSRHEQLALTVDESASVARTFLGVPAASRDVMEMRAEYNQTFLPLYRRFCSGYDGEVRPVSLDVMKRWTANPPVRPVDPSTLHMAEPSKYSPRITPSMALPASFSVDNTQGSADVQVRIDGAAPAGTVVKGGSMRFPVTDGWHSLCLTAARAVCALSDLRSDYFNGTGLVYRLRSPDSK